MGGRGFETAAADCAAAAPRFEEAADALAESVRRTLGGLEGTGAFWGEDEAFERAYLAAWGCAADLAASCEQALRSMAARLSDTAAAYQATDTSVAAELGLLGRAGVGA